MSGVFRVVNVHRSTDARLFNDETMRWRADILGVKSGLLYVGVFRAEKFVPPPKNLRGGQEQGEDVGKRGPKYTKVVSAEAIPNPTIAAMLTHLECCKAPHPTREHAV